mmetsp:Transcript_17597/g.38107  ORF Transcript_17597/g.38107 Transcript_17597/m.38107 type:complete len:201 (-) Transcript_17597:200-802(-)
MTNCSHPASTRRRIKFSMNSKLSLSSTPMRVLTDTGNLAPPAGDRDAVRTIEDTISAAESPSFISAAPKLRPATLSDGHSQFRSTPSYPHPRATRVANAASAGSLLPIWHTVGCGLTSSSTPPTPSPSHHPQYLIRSSVNSTPPSPSPVPPGDGERFSREDSSLLSFKCFRRRMRLRWTSVSATTICDHITARLVRRRTK